MSARHFIEVLRPIKMDADRTLAIGDVVDATGWPNREMIIRSGKARACFPPTLSPMDERRAQA